MSKLSRKNQKIFGVNAGVNAKGVIGSLAAAAPAYTTDVETMQSLSNFESGWYNIILGANSPANQDLNSLFFMICYQLAYLMQTGVAEWNSATTYYIGSLVNDGVGNLYKSITDNNLNNAITDTTKWRAPGGYILSTTTTNSPTIAYNIIECDPTSGGSFTQVLPPLANVPVGFTLSIVNITSGINVISVQGSGAELINFNNIYPTTLASGDSLSVYKSNATTWRIK